MMISKASMERGAVFFALSAVLGTAFDRLHTTFDVLRYPEPVLAGQGWWVPLLMGFSGVAMIGGPGVLFPKKANALPGSSRAVVLALAWFGAAYLVTALVPNHPIPLAVLLSSSFVGAAMAARATLAQWCLAALTGVVGTTVEVALVAKGAFAYTHPDLFGVPIWLPALYLHAALLARAVSLRWPAAPSSHPEALGLENAGNPGV